MLNAEHLANIAEIVGAIVVVITLIYLTIQLHQNNKLLQSASRRAMAENEKASLNQGLEFEGVFRKLDQSERMSAKDQFQLSVLFLNDLENRYFEYQQFKNGLLGKQEWQSRLHIVVENHGITRGRKWWSRIGRDLYPADFVKMVDDVLEAEAPVGMYRIFASWDDEE